MPNHEGLAAGLLAAGLLAAEPPQSLGVTRPASPSLASQGFSTGSEGGPSALDAFAQANTASRRKLMPQGYEKPCAVLSGIICTCLVLLAMPGATRRRRASSLATTFAPVSRSRTPPRTSPSRFWFDTVAAPLCRRGPG